MLVASEKAKRALHLANVPKADNVNAMLANSFTEFELQMMFEDLRFFFPLSADDSLYSKLWIFHELDIFKGEHYRIKETYFEKEKIKLQLKKKASKMGLVVEEVDDSKNS